MMLLRHVCATYSRMVEEGEGPSRAPENIHFTSTHPFAICELSSDGDCVACLRLATGAATRELFGCFSDPEDSWLGKLSTLDDRESLDAMVCL